MQALQSLSMFLAVLAAVWGGALMALLRWLLLTAAVVAAHNAARTAASERLGEGVPFLSALFNRRASHLLRKAAPSQGVWRPPLCTPQRQWCRVVCNGNIHQRPRVIA